MSVLAVTAADQMTEVANVKPNQKMELQIGVYGSGVGTIEVQITRPGGSTRTIATYAANTDPDDLLTVLGPALVEVGIPNGGTYTSGTIDVEIGGKKV